MQQVKEGRGREQLKLSCSVAAPGRGWMGWHGMVWYDDVRGMRVCASSRTQSKISPRNLREGPIATKINSIRSGKEGRADRWMHRNQSSQTTL